MERGLGGGRLAWRLTKISRTAEGVAIQLQHLFSCPNSSISQDDAAESTAEISAKRGCENYRKVLQQQRIAGADGLDALHEAQCLAVLAVRLQRHGEAIECVNVLAARRLEAGDFQSLRWIGTALQVVEDQVVVL